MATSKSIAQARRIIHDNDVDGLKQLLAEYPDLLSWRGDDDEAGLLGIATGAYADSFDPDRERVFTRGACAELLIDAGAVVMPSVCDGIVESRARGLLQLFHRKGVLPRTLKFLTALGEMDAVRSLVEGENERAAVNEAFFCACRFKHEAIASLLLERSIALDPELGKKIDGSLGLGPSNVEGRLAFIRSFTEDGLQADKAGPWQAFVKGLVTRAEHKSDLTAFINELRREPWLLGDDCVGFQIGIIEGATLHNHEDFIVALLDLNPALLRRQPPPRSQAIEFAFTYARTHLVPLLSRIWPVPDDLPHAAGLGNLSRVKRWFDESGAPALGDLENHYPYNDPRARGHLQWNPPTLQQVLDVALAFSVMNRHYDVADYLLEHGANINTKWSSHEPSSLLHELVGQVATGENTDGNYGPMQFLIDRGIDMTIKDYRWNSTAQGWALYAAGDEKMAQWLEDAEREQALRR